MKRIAVSLSAIAFVAAAAYGATGAFFSDTETSSGNTFSAGSINLTVDSTAHYAGLICTTNHVWAQDPVIGPNPTTRPDLIGTPCNESWAQTNLGPTNQFFNYTDVKPGDPGENTISLHTANDAWMCANLAVTSNVDGSGNASVVSSEGPITFETSQSYTAGNINGQNGWSKTGSYDAAVAPTSVAGFGSQSLRISNAVTSGSFGDQTFAPHLSSGAGESTVAPNNHFEAQFDIASVLAALQSGLAISVSPDNGSGARMSYLRFEDQSNGIHVFFDDVTDAGPKPTTATFNESDIATITRAPHTIKFVMDFADGPHNDVVKIYIDGTLIKTGTSWEDYYRYDPEQAGGGNVLSPVNTLLFRAGGTAAPATSGNGFFFDNISLSDGSTVSNSGGALANSIQFVTWLDNSGAHPGDNIHQAGETILSGPAPLNSSGATTTIALSDSTHGPAFSSSATNYVGIAWCVGTMTVNTDGSFSCDGSTVGNEAQNDSMTANVSLFAEQSRNNPNFLCGTGSTTPATTTVVVTADNFHGWNFYDDTSNIINNAIGSFVTGPGTPPLGTGSAQMTATTSNSRVLLENNSYGGIPLSTITQLAYTELSQSGGTAGANEAPFVRFNVDFTTGSPTYQNSLVYVPSANGSITKDTWQSWNMIAGGSALWNYSGSVWPTATAGPDNGVVGTPGTTNKTWATILADYPNIRTWAAGPQIGVRVGEPGPAGYTGNVDSFTIATGGPATTYNFGN